MSTRSNIIVKHSGGTLWLYRHWDGYPSINGAFLYECLKTAHLRDTNRGDYFARFLNALFEARKERSGDSESSAYEFTSGLHGDIEWIYQIAARMLCEKRGWHGTLATGGFEDYQVHVFVADFTTFQVEEIKKN